MSDPHEMENVRWNDLNPDEQDLIVLAYGQGPSSAPSAPDMLTQEELDDIARFVRFAQRRKAGQGSTDEN